MSRFLSSYYICHFLLMCVYPLSRMLFLKNISRTLLEDSLTGFNREAQVSMILVVLLFAKLRKTSTWDETFGKSFMYIHATIIILYFSIESRYAAYYAFATFILWIALNQPRYSEKCKIIKIKDKDHFYNLVDPLNERNSKNQKKKKNFSEMYSTLVVYNASWCDSCIYTYPLWAEFSNKYTTEKMRFAEVDVLKNEGLAREQKINLSGAVGLLPALVMYQDGEEVLRFPPKEVHEKSYAKVNKYAPKELAKYFDLDKRYISTRGT